MTFRCCECGRPVPNATETEPGRCQNHPEAKRYSEKFANAQIAKMFKACGGRPLAEKIATRREYRNPYVAQHADKFLTVAHRQIMAARKAALCR